MFSVHRGPWKEDFYQCLTRDKDRPFWEQTLYPIACVIFMFVLPLSAMLISYALILHTIIKKSKEYSRYNRESMRLTDVDETTGETLHKSEDNAGLITPTLSQQQFFDRQQNIRIMKVALFDRAKIQSFRMFAAIIITFVISWSPYWLLYMLTTIYKLDDSKSRTILGEVSHWIFCFGMLNCALNPVIFGYFNTANCFWRRNVTNNSRGRRMVIKQVTWRPAVRRSPKPESDPIALSQQEGFQSQ